MPFEVDSFAGSFSIQSKPCTGSGSASGLIAAIVLGCDASELSLAVADEWLVCCTDDDWLGNSVGLSLDSEPII